MCSGPVVLAVEQVVGEEEWLGLRTLGYLEGGQLETPRGSEKRPGLWACGARVDFPAAAEAGEGGAGAQGLRHKPSRGEAGGHRGPSTIIA